MKRLLCLQHSRGGALTSDLNRSLVAAENKETQCEALMSR